MRVAMYYSNKDVRLEEKPVPKIGPGEILMKVSPVASAAAKETGKGLRRAV